MKTPERIVIITNMMSYYRLDLFNELVKNRGYEFHVIFSSETEDNARKWEIDKDKLNFNYTVLKSHSMIKKSKGIKETRIITIPRDVFKTLKDIKPDLVIGSEYNPTIIKAFMFCKLSGIKYISWSDGTLNSERFISFPQRLLRKFICAFADGFIASSSETKEAQIGYGADPRRISISLLTVDTEKFAEDLSRYEKKETPCPAILFCGYLIKLKGADLLIRALSKIKSDFRLDVVGSGVEEANLKELVRELGIGSKVNFHGYISRSEIARYYKNADIFVFPGLNDAFGLVLVEAITAGLPVISSLYAGGSRDTVDEGVNGFIIDPSDEKDFADKIDILLGDKALRLKMGAYSLEKSKIFTLGAVAPGFYEAIERCSTGRAAT
jgi:glycosyltransferase involved in cell wall biosynthesis